MYVRIGLELLSLVFKGFCIGNYKQNFDQKEMKIYQINNIQINKK